MYSAPNHLLQHLKAATVNNAPENSILITGTAGSRSLSLGSRFLGHSRLGNIRDYLALYGELRSSVGTEASRLYSILSSLNHPAGEVYLGLPSGLPDEMDNINASRTNIAYAYVLTGLSTDLVTLVPTDIYFSTWLAGIDAGTTFTAYCRNVTGHAEVGSAF